MRLPEPDSEVWINGTVVPGDRAVVPLSDPAVQAGLGVFETLAVRDGRLFDLTAHLSRLADGAARLGIPLAPPDELRAAMRAVAAKVPSPRAWLKVVASRSGTTAIYGGPLEPESEGTPASAVLLRWRRDPKDPLAGIKSLNYAPFALGSEEARRRGADEGIWLNSRGHLVEGCTSNLFVVQGRKLFAPSPRDGALPGIVRAIAIEAARGLGYPVHEGKIRLKRLESADEAFLTSSLRGVRPLVRWQGRPVGSGAPGPVTCRIAREVDRSRSIDLGVDLEPHDPPREAAVSGGRAEPSGETLR